MTRDLAVRATYSLLTCGCLLWQPAAGLGLLPLACLWARRTGPCHPYHGAGCASAAWLTARVDNWYFSAAVCGALLHHLLSVAIQSDPTVAKQLRQLSR